MPLIANIIAVNPAISSLFVIRFAKMNQPKTPKETINGNIKGRNDITFTPVIWEMAPNRAFKNGVTGV